MDVARLQQLFDLALRKRDAVDVAESGHRISIAILEAEMLPPFQAPEAPMSVRPEPIDAVRAPCFGIVHLTPAPDAPPFVRVGDAVAAGQRVCLVEAMKVFNAVAAERDGRVAEICVTSGAEVERGQPLIRLEPVDGGR